MPLRRLAKWIVIFTIGVSFAFNDAIDSATNEVIAKYEDVAKKWQERSWVSRWFFPVNMPELDGRIVKLYQTVNMLQTTGFLLAFAISLRWTYADCRVEGSKTLTFQQICVAALIVNLVLYFAVRSALAFD